MKQEVRRVWAAVVLSALAGCGTLRGTDPPRTATEQLLISTACERAVAGFRGKAREALEGRRVFLDASRFTSYGKEFALSEIRDFLSRQGALLAAARAESEVTVEIRSGALSVDRRDWLFGIPGFEIPGPLSLKMPDIALIRTIEQKGIGKLAFYAYETETGKHMVSSGPCVGKARRKSWWMFGLGPTNTGDVRE